MAAYQYIYVMKGLSKTYPGGREVLKDIWLSFLPGAKIGVLGAERRRQIDPVAHHGGRRARLCRRGLGGGGGAGRLSAAGAGARSGEGRLRQCHRGARRDQGVARPFRGGQRALCRRAVGGRNGCADRRAGRIAGKDRPGRRLGARPHRRDRDGRAALPAGRCRGRQFVRRRAAPGGAVPAAAAAPRPVVARRADQPSRRRVGGLAAALSRRLPGHRRDRHPRPLFPRRGGRLDPRARSRPRHPL